jgi:hypothetical protein
METSVATPWDHGAQTSDLASADLTNDVSVYHITPHMTTLESPCSNSSTISSHQSLLHIVEKRWKISHISIKNHALMVHLAAEATLR